MRVNFIFFIIRLIVDEFYFLLVVSLNPETKIVDEFSTEVPHAVFIFALRYDFIIGFGDDNEVDVILSNEIENEVA